ncbi:unnamed protein product [Trifolium pratense]|uniref:Uncharacterized protein n=1 Tax=Trifolium pratense TaxID=57577 RepID=A0ACB0M135_TRIPR|nr:unnamed protein product [Trifolium pratense]
MGLSKKEEERVERIIRGLLKLPENRRCINCNALGPQYVCTTFSTFVCTNCSGLHREFTHRVKSVSMAKFTPEEVTAIQAGGNERAKQIYFKGWDPLRHSYPDSSNMHRLREFIKNVYVERKYAGERSQENLPRIKLNDKEESNEKPKSSSFRLEFISPKSSPAQRSSSARSDDASVRYLYDESRSPKYVQKCTRNGGYSRSPIKFEVVDDRFRDEEYRNRRQSNLESKLRQLSFDGKNVDRLQTPVQPSSGEMTMQNDLSLQVTTSGGEGSVEEKPSEQKSNKSQAYDNAIVPVEATPSMTQESENNWASFDTSTKENVPKTSNTNTMKSPTTEPTPEAKISSPLDLLLFELSGSFAPTSGENVPTTSTVEKASTLDFPSTSMEEITSSASELAQPSNEATPSQSELLETQDSIEDSHVHKAQTEDSIEVSHAHKPQTENSIEFSHAHKPPTVQSTQPTESPNKYVPSSNEPSFYPNTHESSHTFDELPSQTASNPTQDTGPDVSSQPSIVKTKSSGRMELPEDLFTTKYFSGPPPHPGWQNLQSHVMGYGMQQQYYPNAVLPHPHSALPIAPKSMNPFEVTEGRGLSHASSVPSLVSMYGVVPATSQRTGLIHTSSLGSLDTMMPQSTSYASPIPGLCFDQVNNEDQYHRSKIVNTYNSDLTGFGSLDTIQQSYGTYGTQGIPNSFSNTRRNPFD